MKTCGVQGWHGCSTINLPPYCPLHHVALFTMLLTPPCCSLCHVAHSTMLLSSPCCSPYHVSLFTLLPFPPCGPFHLVLPPPPCFSSRFKMWPSPHGPKQFNELQPSNQHSSLWKEKKKEEEMYKFSSWTLRTYARSFSCFGGLWENPNTLFHNKVLNNLR